MEEDALLAMQNENRDLKRRIAILEKKNKGLSKGWKKADTRIEELEMIVDWQDSELRDANKDVRRLKELNPDKRMEELEMMC